MHRPFGGQGYMVVKDTRIQEEEENCTMRQIIGEDKAREVDSGQIMHSLESHGNNLSHILRARRLY